MDSIGGIIEWYKGSGLRPYLNALRDEQRKDFLSDLLSQLKQYYKSQQDGRSVWLFVSSVSPLPQIPL